MDEDETDQENFTCFVDPMKPRKWHWFKVYDATETIARVERALDEILRSDPEITNVVWGSQP